jgi:hypothetical protein
MELLEALKEISSEGLLKEEHGIFGYMGGICWKASQKSSKSQYQRISRLLEKMGKCDKYPISVTGEEHPMIQYQKVASGVSPEYNNDYLAARWYLLHEMINELELQ